MTILVSDVVLVRRLTKDPDLRYTAGGTAVVTFTLAVSRNFINRSGGREADFVDYVIWRKSAGVLANYARKGTLLGVTGRIQTRFYDSQQRQRVYVTEVVTDNFQLLGSRSASEDRQQSGGFQSSSQSAGGFGGNNNSNQTSQSSNDIPDFDRGTSDLFSSSSAIDISDDDLPF